MRSVILSRSNIFELRKASHSCGSHQRQENAAVCIRLTKEARLSPLLLPLPPVMTRALESWRDMCRYLGRNIGGTEPWQFPSAERSPSSEQNLEEGSTVRRKECVEGKGGRGEVGRDCSKKDRGREESKGSRQERASGTKGKGKKERCWDSSSDPTRIESASSRGSREGSVAELRGGWEEKKEGRKGEQSKERTAHSKESKREQSDERRRERRRDKRKERRKEKSWEWRERLASARDQKRARFPGDVRYTQAPGHKSHILRYFKEQSASCKKFQPIKFLSLKTEYIRVFQLHPEFHIPFRCITNDFNVHSKDGVLYISPIEWGLQLEWRASTKGNSPPPSHTEDTPTIQTQDTPTTHTEDTPTIQTQDTPTTHTEDTPTTHTQDTPTILSWEAGSPNTTSKEKMKVKDEVEKGDVENGDVVRGEAVRELVEREEGEKVKELLRCEEVKEELVKSDADEEVEERVRSGGVMEELVKGEEVKEDLVRGEGGGVVVETVRSEGVKETAVNVQIEEPVEDSLTKEDGENTTLKEEPLLVDEERAGEVLTEEPSRRRGGEEGDGGTSQAAGEKGVSTEKTKDEDKVKSSVEEVKGILGGVRAVSQESVGVDALKGGSAEGVSGESAILNEVCMESV